MKSWDDIVNKSLLGSEKAPLTVADLPPKVVEEFDFIATDNVEDTFLKISTITYQYRQSGIRPLNLSSLENSEALPESKSYCSTEANATLKTILDEDLRKFLDLWLRQCVASNQIVDPAIITSLFELAEHRKELREPVMIVAGKRGEWLSNLNPEWRFTTDDADIQSTWETGTPQQRKDVLKLLRKTNPSEARTMLGSTWASEGANEKLAFLDIMKTNISSTDIPWIESLKEKGQKINNAIRELLKSVPGSTIVREYENVLKESVTIKSGKSLLGMISKTELVINQSFAFPESIFKTGIDKLSSDKNVSDQQYIFVQLITNVPPTFWSQHFQKSPPEIIDLFRKEKQNAFYLPGIAVAAVKFSDLIWIKALLDKMDDEVLDSSLVTLLGALSEPERDRYALRFLKDKPREVIRIMTMNETEWSPDLTKAILKNIAEEVYHYNKTFFHATAALMHVSVLNALDSINPMSIEKDKQVYWNNQREELVRLLNIKQQTLQSFTA